ncbi:MAG: hypothetical protein M3143_10040 [Actinomycetota bacterium]|nr:hypothetical protein [Actinomycetota bacterium]
MDERPEEHGQPGVGDIDFGLVPVDADNPQILGAFGSGGKEPGLPHPRVAANDQRSGLALYGICQHELKPFALVMAPNQHEWSLTRWQREHG